MQKTISVEIVDANAEIYKGEATMVVASATNGEVGILPGHIPFLSTLKPGQINIKQVDNSEANIFVNGGFIEVQGNSVSILADEAERAENLDEKKVEADLQQAQNEINENPDGPNFAKAQQDLAEASARLEFIQKLRK